MTVDANNILMNATGAPAARFDTPGVIIGGQIVGRPQAFQEREFDPKKPGGGAPKHFPSGDPIMGILIDVSTDIRVGPDDDGIRRIYVQGRRMKEAIRNAVTETGAAGLEAGATLEVVFTHQEDPADRQSAKHYTARYTPLTSAAQPPTQIAPPSAAINTWQAQTLTAAHTQAATPQQQPVQQPVQTPPVAPGTDHAALQAAMANLSPEVIAAIQAAQTPAG